MKTKKNTVSVCVQLPSGIIRLVTHKKTTVGEAVRMAKHKLGNIHVHWSSAVFQSGH
jgi:hypothetical protein